MFWYKAMPFFFLSWIERNASMRSCELDLSYASCTDSLISTLTVVHSPLVNYAARSRMRIICVNLPELTFSKAELPSAVKSFPSSICAWDLFAAYISNSVASTYLAKKRFSLEAPRYFLHHLQRHLGNVGHEPVVSFNGSFVLPGNSDG